jgi:hypothetical protein
VVTKVDAEHVFGVALLSFRVVFDPYWSYMVITVWPRNARHSCDQDVLCRTVEKHRGGAMNPPEAGLVRVVE